MSIKLSSPVFDQGDFIPKKYTCDSLNISPPLEWEGTPPTTKTLAIICEDPDETEKVWTHWIIFNLPAQLNKLHEEMPISGSLEAGIKQGKNDFGRIGYDGPRPATGIHSYKFNIFALDKELTLPPGVSKYELIEAMKGHILEKGQLIAKFAH
jgi:Raf kinase inhibitor-like YbhB/YbcL family protein